MNDFIFFIFLGVFLTSGRNLVELEMTLFH